MAHFCPQCGAPTESDDKFCKACGTKLDEIVGGENLPKKSKQKRTPAKTAGKWLDLALESKDPEEKLEYCTKHLELNPNDGDVWDYKAHILEVLGRDKEAIDCVGKGVDCHLQHLPRHLHESYYTGFISRNINNEGAVKEFDHILMEKPDAANIWLEKGDALGCLDKNEEAITCFDKVLALKPGKVLEAQAWHGKGRAFYGLKRFEQAIQCLNTSLEIDPGNAEAYTFKGAILLEGLGECEAALKCFDDALEILKANPDSEMAKLAKEYREDAKKMVKKRGEFGEDAKKMVKKRGEFTQYPWVFKGAYAIYSGATKVKPIPGTTHATVKLEVKDIDFDNQRVKFCISTTTTQQTWLANKAREKEWEGWVKIGERVLPSAPDNTMVLDAEYEGVLNVEGLGVRKCIIQQWHEIKKYTKIVSAYELQFWDKELNWPLRFMAAFNYKTKYPEGVFSGIVKDALKGTLKDLERYVESGKLSTTEVNRSAVIKEASLIFYLKETNIPQLKIAAI